MNILCSIVGFCQFNCVEMDRYVEQIGKQYAVEDGLMMCVQQWPCFEQNGAKSNNVFHSTWAWPLY